MNKKVWKYALVIVLSVIIIAEWISVFFLDGVISVISWWFIMGSSFVGVILLIITTWSLVYKIIKYKKCDALLLSIMMLTVIISYPICWFFGIGQIAYPAKIETAKPVATIRLPFNETTVVGWGGDSIETNYPHAVVPMERWAYDLLMKPYSTKDKDLKRYGIYDAEVICPANGYVVGAYDCEDDIMPGSEDSNSMTGNYIYLKLEETGTYLVFAHLKKNSITVKEGQYIEEGVTMAKVGNSGSTSEPHLHIHHQRENPKTTSIFLTEGLPLYFTDIDGPSMPSGGLNGDIISPILRK